MKTRLILLSLSILLFSSCIVKSIQPFYISGQQKFNDVLLGNWTDHKKGEWEFVSFKTEWEKENQDPTKLMKEDREAFEIYKESYVVKYVKKEVEAFFIAMPFKVGDQLYMDFTPFEYDSSDLNGLAAQHLLKTHSAVIIEKKDDDSVNLKWISEEALNYLLHENRLRIKHEKTGIDQDFVLTANSDELYKFLERFNTMEFDKKWDNDVIYKLKRQDARP
ncbi:MAG: hypothetical protein HRU26_14135 [Psychroserpens sp.]|nr:hypothetical protein [Psychroserpens sp.]